MKTKTIVALSAAVITVGSIGGVAFASNIDTQIEKDVQQTRLEVADNSSKIKGVSFYNQEPNPNSSNNPSKDEFKDMIKIMRENGFKDMARYMQTGDYEKMNEYMDTLSEEDFQEMIEIMKENGYTSMALMMESMGRENMIQMHRSMGSMYSGGSGMMGGYTPGI